MNLLRGLLEFLELQAEGLLRFLNALEELDLLVDQDSEARAGLGKVFVRLQGLFSSRWLWCAGGFNHGCSHVFWQLVLPLHQEAKQWVRGLVVGVLDPGRPAPSRLSEARPRLLWDLVPDRSDRALQPTLLLALVPLLRAALGRGEEALGGFCGFLGCCLAGAGAGHFLPHCWQCVWPCCTLLAHVQAPHLQTKYWRFWPISKDCLQADPGGGRTRSTTTKRKARGGSCKAVLCRPGNQCLDSEASGGS